MDVAYRAIPTLGPGRHQDFSPTLVALNHPHIAQIYSLEKSDGLTALVMELLTGHARGSRKIPIPVDEVLPITKQTVEALKAAHEPGIIHHDLKRANIKLRADGTVTLLDSAWQTRSIRRLWSRATRHVPYDLCACDAGWPHSWHGGVVGAGWRQGRQARRPPSSSISATFDHRDRSRCRPTPHRFGV
jgi:serine/threonine protein kinase